MTHTYRQEPTQNPFRLIILVEWFVAIALVIAYTQSQSLLVVVLIIGQAGIGSILVLISHNHLRKSLEQLSELYSVEHRSNEFRQRILTMINHEFRTPLTYITASASLLQSNGGLSNEERIDLLRRVRLGSDRLNRIVESFLFLVASYVSEASLSYRLYRRPIFGEDWKTLIEGIVSKRKSWMTHNGEVGIVPQVERKLPPIAAYLPYLEMAIGHLLDNAVKFTPQGSIAVSVTAANSGVSIEVRDTGIGINQRDMSRLFVPLEQLTRDDQEHSGMGLGLAVVKQIVNIHKGNIDVESQVGIGSTFTIHLPALT